MQRLWFIIGGIAVLATSFFGTLFILSSFDDKPRDSVRAEHARMLKAALEKYHSAHGKYPSHYDNNLLVDLKKDLVDEGFLVAIPRDPFWPPDINQYRYVSETGARYGLLMYLELPHGKISAGGACLTGVGTAGVGWWGPPPDCPF